MSSRVSEIREYLRTWGYMRRLDGIPKAYTQINWHDFVGEESVSVPDKIMQQVCFYMSKTREQNPNAYLVCDTIYIKQFETEISAARVLGISRQALRRHRHVAEFGLAEYLFGVQTQADPDARRKIQHWGEYPAGPVAEPTDWKSRA